MEKKTFGENIKFYREMRELTQTELASKTGYSNSSTLAKIEKNLISPSIERAEEIAKALDVSLERLVSDSDDEYSMLIEAYKRAPINDKMSIKMILGIPFTQAELNEISCK